MAEQSLEAKELAELLFHCDNPDLGWFTREIDAFADRIRAEAVASRDHLLNHIHREVCSFEDFDAESLKREIEETLSGSKIFDDNKHLHAEIERLKATAPAGNVLQVLEDLRKQLNHERNEFNRTAMQGNKKSNNFMAGWFEANSNAKMQIAYALANTTGSGRA